MNIELRIENIKELNINLFILVNKKKNKIAIGL